jgi:hypothetical protein
MPALAYAYARARGQGLEPAADERLSRLRNRKAAVANQIDERRAAARFDPVADETATPSSDFDQALADASGGAASAPARPAPPTSSTPQTEQETYTERLLAAKKKAKKS